VPIDPEDSPATDHVDDSYGRRHGFRTARGSPGVDAHVNEDKLTALSYLLDLEGGRASGSVDRVFWVDELDVRVRQLFEPCHHSVHGLAAVDHLERSAHKLLVRPSHELSITLPLSRVEGAPRDGISAVSAAPGN